MDSVTHMEVIRVIKSGNFSTKFLFNMIGFMLLPKLIMLVMSNMLIMLMLSILTFNLCL